MQDEEEKHRRLFDESHYDNDDDNENDGGEGGRPNSPSVLRGGSVLAVNVDAEEEEPSSSSALDEDSPSCSVSWCVFIPVAAVVTFTVFVTIIAQMGVFIGLRAVFPHGIVVSPYPPETTSTLLNDYGIDATLSTKYVAPVVTHLLSASTLPVGINASSHDLIVSCSSTSYYCPKYYRCAVSDSRCVFDLPSSNPPTHPSPNVRLCEATISQWVTQEYNDIDSYRLFGIYTLKASSFDFLLLVTFLAFSLLSMASIVVLMQDIRQHEEDEEEFEDRLFSLVSTCKRHIARAISTGKIESKRRLQVVLVSLGVFIAIVTGLICFAPTLSVVGAVSGFEDLVSNECLFPPDLPEVLTTAKTTDPAQHTAVNLMRILKQLLRSCVFTVFVGSTYVILVFSFTSYRRVWRDTMHKFELHQYTSSSSSASSSSSSLPNSHNGNSINDSELQIDDEYDNGDITVRHDNSSARVEFDIE